MMRKRTYFSALCLQVFLLLFVCLCSCTSATKGCVIKGSVKTKGYEGKTVYLCSSHTSAALDSACVQEGKFNFSRGEEETDVLVLMLKASADDSFPITLPVVTENGTVKVVLGETVFTSGTPLNDKLQDFLLTVSRFSDETVKFSKDIERIRTDFMHLLQASILQNKDNCVGMYIFRAYSSHLTPECRADILEKAGEGFKKEIETE